MFVGSLSRLVHGEGLTIPQLGQVWVNIDHLANSIHQLEKFIVNTVTKSVSNIFVFMLIMKLLLPSQDRK